MPEIGSFIDRYNATVRVERDHEGAILIRADSPDAHYRNPSPHLTIEMARQMGGFLASGAEPSPVVGHTGRGWADYGGCDILDLNGHAVTVRESSIAGGACVWIFCTDPKPGEARYKAHKAIYDAWSPEKQKVSLPTWIRYDYSDPRSDHTQLRDYTDCPEEKENLINSWLHQKWEGEDDLPPSPTPRLSPEMAHEVARRLAAFIEEMEGPGHWRNSPEYKGQWGEE